MADALSVQDITADTSAAVSIEADGLSVAWPDGLRFVFHPVWLRERADDGATLDPRTGQRLLEAAFLPPDLTLVAASADDDEVATVRFSDGHTARYDLAMLRAALAQPEDLDRRLPPRLWDARTADGPPRRPLAALASDPAALLALLDDVEVWGYSLLTGAPREKNGVRAFTDLIGNIRLTNWGGIEDVKYAADAFDLTLTSRALEPHVDNPYRLTPIGYVVLHCLENSAPGGDSTVVDGFAVAERLRREDPAGYLALTEVPVYFRYQDDDAVLENVRPLIELSAEARIRSIAWSNRTEFVQVARADLLDRYYAARRRFAELLYDESMTLTFKLTPGDIAVFDNYRVLHGRRAFDAAEGGGWRHLRQAYLDRDMVASRREVLRRRLGGRPVR